MASPKRVEEESFFVFLLEADKDYILARHINTLGGAYGSRAGLFGQACCEKYMKALTVERDGFYLQHHSLTRLARECEPYSDYFSLPSTKEGLELFEHFEQIGRYGAASQKDRHRVDTPELQVRGLSAWGNNHIHVLDALVHEIRGLISIEPTYIDPFRRIIANESEGMFLADTWKGAEPIRDVLLRNNFSFGRDCGHGTEDA